MKKADKSPPREPFHKFLLPSALLAAAAIFAVDTSKKRHEKMNDVLK